MILSDLNQLSKPNLITALTKCCGAARWVERMAAIFPVKDEETLLRAAGEIWHQCNEDDWLEAFAHHPKIGDIASMKTRFATTSQWAQGEQSGVANALPKVLEAFAEGNKIYEQKFGYIFIVFATGKPAETMLAMLEQRLHNTPEKEITIAMAEQEKITKLRLQKLLS